MRTLIAGLTMTLASAAMACETGVNVYFDGNPVPFSGCVPDGGEVWVKVLSSFCDAGQELTVTNPDGTQQSYISQEGIGVQYDFYGYVVEGDGPLDWVMEGGDGVSITVISVCPPQSDECEFDYNDDGLIDIPDLVIAILEQPFDIGRVIGVIENWCRPVDGSLCCP